MARWINRVWDMVVRDPAELDTEPKEALRRISGNEERETLRLLHQTVRKCYNDLDRFKFNTGIAALMEFSNHLNRVWTDASIDSGTWRECVEKFLLMLAPIAPHVSEELWERTGRQYSIHQQPFPVWGRRCGCRRHDYPGGSGQWQSPGSAGGSRRHSGGSGSAIGSGQPPGPELHRGEVGEQGGLRARPIGEPGGEVAVSRPVPVLFTKSLSNS